MSLDRLAVGHQGIRGPVQLHRPHGLEVHAQQLPQGAALAQPGVRGPLRGRVRQPRHDRGHRRRAQRRVDAQGRQQLHQAQPLDRPQPHLLDAHAARARQLERRHVHADRIARRLGVPGPAAGQQLRGDPLRFFLNRSRRIVDERRLAVQDLVDAPAQLRPRLFGQVEIAAEVQQRALADLGAVALAVHEAGGSGSPGRRRGG